MTENSHIAVVTGAGSGIGRAVAHLLGERGITVVLAGRRREPLEETAEGVDAETLIVSADVSTSEGATEPIRAARSAFGRLDILVNNAASAPMKPFPEFTWGELEALYRLNVLGVHAAIAEAWPTFAAQHADAGSRARIVNVSSMATVDPFPGLSAYAGAKAAVNLLTKGVANEGAESGVLSFAVAPGAVETHMLRSLISEDVLPRENTLAPEEVAEVIVACACGERDEENGGVILVPSPE